MESTQNVTFDPKPEEVAAVNVPSDLTLKLQQQSWIDFKAVGGLLTDEDGKLDRMTQQQFADTIKVTRKTLNTWTRSIPNFWELVRARQRELFKQNRGVTVMNRLYMEAAKGNVQAIKFYHEAYLDYQPPAQRHDIQITGGVADLLDRARERESKTIEGEVTSERPPTND